MTLTLTDIQGSVQLWSHIHTQCTMFL